MRVSDDLLDRGTIKIIISFMFAYEPESEPK